MYVKKKKKHQGVAGPGPGPDDILKQDSIKQIGSYRVLQAIGRGGFGTVYKCFHQEKGVTVAIKRVDLHGASPEDLENIQMEIKLLQGLDHPNIVRYIDTVHEDERLNIVLEYVESGQLSSLFGMLDGHPPETLIAHYTSQILLGLDYLHSQGVIHRDIKGANILSTKEGLIKLADFGVATKLSETSHLQDTVGTPFWMAPEVIEMKQEHSSACDIWSVGCTVVELLTGKPPYFDLNAMAAMYRIVQDPHPPLPENISPALRDFLLRCFTKDPNARIDAAGLMNHPWVTSTVKKSGEKKEGESTSTSTDSISSPASKPEVKAEKSQDFSSSNFVTSTQEQQWTLTLVMSRLRTQKEDESRTAELLQGYCDLGGMLTGADGISVRRMLLQQEGVLEFVEALESQSRNEKVVEGVLTVINTMLAPRAAKDQKDQKEKEPSDYSDLILEFVRVFLAMGLIGKLHRFLDLRTAPSIRVLSAALIRICCFVDCLAFCTAGGLRCLVALMETPYDVIQSDNKIIVTALECMEHVLHTPSCAPITTNDLCRRLAPDPDLVRLLINCIADAHTHNLKREESALPKLVAASRKKVNFHRAATSKESVKEKKKPGAYTTMGKNDPMGAKIFALRAIAGFADTDALDQAMVQYHDTIDNLDVHVPDGPARVFGVMLKIARVLNTLAKAQEVVQQHFADKDCLERMLDVCVMCPDNFVSMPLINTLAVLVSSPSTLERITTVMQTSSSDSYIMASLIAMLERFIAMSVGTSVQWHWVVADCLHCVHCLAMEPAGLDERESKLPEKSALQYVVELGLIPHLVSLLNSTPLSRPPPSPNAPPSPSSQAAQPNSPSSLLAPPRRGASPSLVGAPKTSSSTNSTQIMHVEGRKEPPDMGKFLFPLISRVGLAAEPAVQQEFHRFPPVLLMPLMVHPLYGRETLEILAMWMLAEDVRERGEKTAGAEAEDFLSTTETINCILSLMRAVPASEYLQVLLVLQKILATSSTVNQSFGQSTDFLEEVRQSLSGKYSSFTHNQIRIAILKLIHLFLTHAPQPGKIIKHLNLVELLTPLSEDHKMVIVQSLAKALLNQYTDRDDDVEKEGTRKYLKKNIHKCMICTKKFGLLLRKHYCKQCQFVVCRNCSPDFVIVPHVNQEKPKRICKNCSSFLNGGLGAGNSTLTPTTPKPRK